MTVEYKVVIEPQAGGQCLALSCPADEILFEGTRGSMKTATQLMKFRSYVGLGYGAFWKGVIFDLEFKNLDDIIAQSKKLFNLFEDGAKFHSSASSLKWVWPTGEELLFRYAAKAEDYWKYHGQELPFVGYNELTKRTDDEFYESMFSCVRSSFRPQDYPLANGNLLPDIPLMTFSTTNPFGVGHNWVKKRFINPVPRGTINRISTIVLNPATQLEEEVITSRVAIHGTWKENKFLSVKYVAGLMAIKDPNKRKAWVYGSWDVTSGGRFDHLWDAKTHIIKPFTIPRTWKIDRSHDWGESKPFSNLWFAEADGSENEQGWAPPRGTIICIGEMYGCKPDEMNKGLNMSATNVAKIVKWVDRRMLGEEVEQPIKFEGECNIIPSVAKHQRRINEGPADNAINNPDDEQISLADKMAAQGVTWTESDKRPGSRVSGAYLLCEMLEAALEGKSNESGIAERPALYFFENVRGIISRFPILARDSKNPDDIDTSAEDHDYDALRYRVTAKDQTPSKHIGYT